MKRSIVRAAIGFVAFVLVALLVCAWITLQWPNPLSWEPVGRFMLLWWSCTGALVSWMIGEKRS